MHKGKTLWLIIYSLLYRITRYNTWNMVCARHPHSSGSPPPRHIQDASSVTASRATQVRYPPSGMVGLSTKIQFFLCTWFCAVENTAWHCGKRFLFTVIITQFWRTKPIFVVINRAIITNRGRQFSFFFQFH